MKAALASSPMLAEGDTAPDFTLPGTEGDVKLSGLRGQSVVLYFYPKDDTPGCTVEAKDFSAMKERFAKAGTTIIGISRDSVKSHEKFVSKYNLTIPLVADEEGVAAEAYGVWVEKSMYGKTYMGIERATFLIDRKGALARIWRKVKVEGHAEEVLKAAEGLNNANR